MELHPEGFFKAEIINAVLGETQAGKPQIIADFQTEKGKVRGYFSLSEKSVEYTAEKLMCMGFKGDSWSDVNQAGFSMAGNRCQVSVQHDEWEGKTNAKVGFVYPENYSPELQGSDLAAANARKFDGVLAAVKGKYERGEKIGKAKAKKAPPTTTQPVDLARDNDAPPFDADGVPF